MPDFLHGVETIEKSTVPAAVRGVKSAVVGIVGTAPIHHVAVADRKTNEPVLLLSDVDDAKYCGPDVEGYSLPKALKHHRMNGVGLIIVVNVFAPATHKDDVVAADLDITDGKIQLANGDLTALTVKAEGGTGAALVEGTDYSVDRVTGLITVLAGGALAAADAANVAYSHGAPEDIDSDDIVGTTEVSGDRTGLQAMLDAKSKFGFGPKILEAPGYSSASAVTQALAAINPKLRSIAWVDTPVGTTFAEALEARGPDGELNVNLADKGVMICVPHVKVGGVVSSLATSGAALTAYTDQTEGFWVSPSNHVIKGADGLEYPITWALNDSNTEANQLNAAGFVTCISEGGYRLWGNRSSAFPTNGDIFTFLKAIRTRDQIHEAIENFCLPFVDKDIGPAVIDIILQGTNDYMKLLAGRGAVPYGSRVELFPAKNPPSQIALGQLVFTQIWSPVPPLERTTFESVVDISLLSNLLPAAS